MKRSLRTLGALALSLSLAAAPAKPGEPADTDEIANIEEPVELDPTLDNEAETENDQAAELEELRGISAANMATYADLCNLVTIDLEEYEQFETAEDRCLHLSEQGLLNLGGIDDVYSASATHGAAAKAAILAFELERNLLFRLTGLEWYAVQNAETLEIVPEFSTSSKPMSGEELLAIMAKARELAEERADWGIEKNIYEEFGQSSYEEVESEYEKESPEAATEKEGKK